MLSFIDFLKKYSKVPNQFLEDFFHLFDYRDYESNQKIVDFEKVVNWLDITKHKAKDTLIKSYRKNIDYIIKKVNKPEGIIYKLYQVYYFWSTLSLTKKIIILKLHIIIKINKFYFLIVYIFNI